MTRALGGLTSFAKAAPFALAAVIGLWVMGLAGNTIVHGPTVALLSRANLGLPAFSLHGTWYPLASRIWCADLAGYLVTTLLFLVLCAPAERILGSRRTANIFLCSLLGTTAVVAGIAAISGALSADGPSGLRTASAVGPSTGAFGVLLALTHTLTPLWRRRIRVLSIVGLATLVLYSGQLQDVSRLAAALIGLLCGPLLLTTPAAGRRWRVARATIEPQERRLLVALVVVALAAGPLVLLLNRVANGPAARLKGLLMAPSPTRAVVRHLCPQPAAPASCHTVVGYVISRSFGAEIRMILPVLIACVLAEGLRRGYRSAYVGALGFHIVLAAVGVAAILHGALGASWSGGGSGLQLSKFARDVSADLIPAGVALLIYVMRDHFTVRSRAGAYRRLLRLSAGVLVGTSTIYLIGGYLARAQFDRAFGFGDLLRNLPSRFLPPEYLGLIKPRFHPVSGVAGELSDWTGAVFWIVVLAALLVMFRRGGALEHHAEPTEIRRMLREYGGSNLAYMSTWEGHDHWLSSDRRSAFAYRVISSVAITTGEPLGDPARKASAVREFSEFCARNGWTPCLFCVSEDFLPAIEAQQWHALKVANDAVIPLAPFDLSGRRLQDVRTAMHRAGRKGIEARWIDFHDASPSLVQQIAAMGRQLRASRGAPELSFTIGGVPELLDSQTRCLVAVDPEGVVHGVVSWIPVFRAGEVVGWTLDFMRRSPDGLKGVMDFLIASSALSFRQEGSEMMSLSGVPLPPDTAGRSPSAVERVLDGAGSLVNRAFRFESLLAFKDKFRPDYESLFLAYRDGMDLPRIAYAVGRAYLPSVTLREAIGFGRSVLFTGTSRRRSALRWWALRRGSDDLAPRARAERPAVAEAL
ncbi:MAG TPA: DUF2156 domain-containing protein [Acidimicrobiales bacterium]|nr:DUF2156 domain-containing protein [Acidimicrobiales bacterium]